jgi:hypothetical protein
VFCVHYCLNCSICSVNKHCYLLNQRPIFNNILHNWMDRLLSYLSTHWTVWNFRLSLSTNLTVNPTLHLSQSLPIYMSAYASKEQYLFRSWPWHLVSLLKRIFCSSVPTEKCKPSMTAVVIKILHLKIMCCHHCQLYQIIKLAMVFKRWLKKLEELTLLIFLSSLFQSIQFSLV